MLTCGGQLLKSCAGSLHSKLGGGTWVDVRVPDSDIGRLHCQPVLTIVRDYPDGR